MQSITNRILRITAATKVRAARSWAWYRNRSRWQQIAIAALLLALIGGGIALARGGTATPAASQMRTVTLASVGSLSGNGSGTSIVGSVRSVTEAELHSEAGGTVKSVRTTLGATVPAGFVIATLDNASEAAAVLQAEGAYDSAIASRNSQSLPDTRTSARDTYRAAYTSIDTAVQNDIDQFFGSPTPTGPRLLINMGPSSDLPRKRNVIEDRMKVWLQRLATSASTDPAALLDQATADTQAVSAFLLELSRAANATDSDASADQMAALASARASVDTTLARLTAARAGLRTGTVSATASADASVKSALGSLRAAQASYEKTRIRATIGGTVNFLPIKIGQYVSSFEHVATIANNGALEIVAYVPEETRNSLSVGMKVEVEGGHEGTITEMADALNPVTKQVEVHIAVDAAPDLINGQSVRITLPAESGVKTEAEAPAGPIQVLLPLTSVKLLPNSRAVFTVDTEGRIVAHTVTIGDVVGDRIQVISGVTADMRIVTDVRGLSAGQKVQIDEATN